MIITCGDCGARFHLDPALLKDSSAARIRCRKCGGLIVVRLHEESPVPVLPPQETIPPSTGEPAAPHEEPLHRGPRKPPCAGMGPPCSWKLPRRSRRPSRPDISGVVTSEPIPPPPEPRTRPARDGIFPGGRSVCDSARGRCRSGYGSSRGESPGGDGRNGTRAQGSIPTRTLHAQSPRPLRVVDSPAGRRRVLLRNHEVRARYVGHAVRGFRIVAHGERPGETGLRHPGREVARR